VKLEDQAQTPNSEVAMKKLEELTEEEKESLIEDSKNFAAELERCVFDNYSEGDIAGAKYKYVIPSVVHVLLQLLFIEQGSISNASIQPEQNRSNCHSSTDRHVHN